MPSAYYLYSIGGYYVLNGGEPLIQDNQVPQAIRIEFCFKFLPDPVQSIGSTSNGIFRIVNPNTGCDSSYVIAAPGLYQVHYQFSLNNPGQQDGLINAFLGVGVSPNVQIQQISLSLDYLVSGPANVFTGSALIHLNALDQIALFVKQDTEVGTGLGLLGVTLNGAQLSILYVSP